MCAGFPLEDCFQGLKCGLVSLFHFLVDSNSIPSSAHSCIMHSCTRFWNFLFSCGDGYYTQGIAHAWAAVYQWTVFSKPFYFFLLIRHKVFLCCSAWPLTHTHSLPSGMQVCITMLLKTFYFETWENSTESFKHNTVISCTFSSSNHIVLLSYTTICQYMYLWVCVYERERERQTNTRVCAHTHTGGRFLQYTVLQEGVTCP